MTPMPEPLRISALEVRKGLSTAKPLLLVCAYEDDRSYHLAKLEGSISFSEFKFRQASLSQEEVIVFY